MFDYQPNGPLCLFLTCAALPIAALLRQLNPRLAQSPMPHDWTAQRLVVVAVGLILLSVLTAALAAPMAWLAQPLMALGELPREGAAFAGAGAAFLAHAGRLAWQASLYFAPLLLAICWVTEVRWTARATGVIWRVLLWPMVGLLWTTLIAPQSTAELLAIAPLLWTVPVQVALLTNTRRLRRTLDAFRDWRHGLAAVAVPADEAPQTRITRLPEYIAGHEAARRASVLAEADTISQSPQAARMVLSPERPTAADVYSW